MPIAIWMRNLAIALALSCGAGAGGHWVAVQLGGEAAEDAPAIPMPAFLADLGDEAQKSRARLSVDIFARNLAVYALLLAGVLSAGLTTAFTLAFNGFMVGQLLGVATVVGAPIGAALWLLAPHGVLELSLLLLAAAIGLQGPAAALAWARGRRLPWQPLRIARVAAAGVPLLAVAAAIEGFLTMPLARAALLP